MGRHALPLSETVDYTIRKWYVLKWLENEPELLAREIHKRLRDVGMGGKGVTVSRIIAECRSELGLRARIPSRRKLNV